MAWLFHMRLFIQEIISLRFYQYKREHLNKKLGLFIYSLFTRVKYKTTYFVVSAGNDQEQVQFIINSGHLFFMRYHKHVSDI